MIHNADKRSLNRLIVWMSVGTDAQYGNECILGARMGALNAIDKDNNEKELFEINDFERCKEIFESTPSYATKHIESFGLEILEKEFNREIVLYNPKQSRVFKELMYRI